MTHVIGTNSISGKLDQCSVAAHLLHILILRPQIALAPHKEKRHLDAKVLQLRHPHLCDSFESPSVACIGGKKRLATEKEKQSNHKHWST